MVLPWVNRDRNYNPWGEKRRGNFVSRHWKWIAGIVAAILIAGMIPIIVVFTRNHATEKSTGVQPLPTPQPSSPTASVTVTNSGTTPRSTTTASPTAAVGSKGCGTSLPRHYSKENTVEDGVMVDGTNRTFLVYIPSEYSLTSPAPIVLSYHGRGETAEDQEALSNFSVEGSGSNPGNWVAVYPQGENNSWQGAPYAIEGVDDLDFTTAMVDYLESALCIDTTRLYAAGKSNGGGFTNLLACNTTFSTRLAAIAPVSAALYDQIFTGCAPSRSIIPIYDIHGTADSTVAYGGGSSWGEDYESIETAYEGWATRQGCTPNTPSGGWQTMNEWHCEGGSKTTITQYKVSGMGHIWPSKQKNADNPDGGNVAGTALIMAFFQQWTLNGFVG